MDPPRCGRDAGFRVSRPWLRDSHRGGVLPRRRPRPRSPIPTKRHGAASGGSRPPVSPRPITAPEGGEWPASRGGGAPPAWATVCKVRRLGRGIRCAWIRKRSTRNIRRGGRDNDGSGGGSGDGGGTWGRDGGAAHRRRELDSPPPSLAAAGPSPGLLSPPQPRRLLASRPLAFHSVLLLCRLRGHAGEIGPWLQQHSRRQPPGRPSPGDPTRLPRTRARHTHLHMRRRHPRAWRVWPASTLSPPRRQRHHGSWLGGRREGLLLSSSGTPPVRGLCGPLAGWCYRQQSMTQLEPPSLPSTTTRRPPGGDGGDCRGGAGKGLGACYEGDKAKVPAGGPLPVYPPRSVCPVVLQTR